MQSLTISGPANPKNLSPQQIHDLVNLRSGYATVTARYSLRDTHFQPVSVGTPGLTGDYADITVWVQTATITNSTKDAVHRKLDITLTELPTLPFHPTRHMIQVYVDYWDTAKNLLLEVPVGLFWFAIPDRSLDMSGNTWTVQGLDVTGWVSQIDGFENTYTIPAGTNYVTAIRALLQMDRYEMSGSLGRKAASSPYQWPDGNNPGATPAGLDAVGPNFDPARIRIPPCTQTTPSSISFSVTDNMLTKVNELLAAINYYDLCADSLGYLWSAPKPYYTVAQPSIGWTYNTDATSIINGAVKQSFGKATDMANVIKVISEPNGATPIFAVEQNDSLDSYISRPNLGRAVYKTIRDDKIPDQETCNLRAFLELQKAATLSETLDFETAPNPFHESHDFLAINIYSRAGVLEVSSQAYPFEETDWTLSLDPGNISHKHTVGKVVGV